MRLSEHDIQKAFFSWCDFQPTLEKYPELRLMHAIPSGMWAKNIQIALKAKSEGLKSGVPDTHLPVARKGFHGLYIEFKRDKKLYLSANQKKWFEWLRKEGNKCEVVRSTDEAIKIVEDYLGG